MPVAVRLVEILALLTMLGILTSLSIFIVAAQRIVFILLLVITPLSYIIYGLLYLSEKVMVSALNALLLVTGSVGEF